MHHEFGFIDDFGNDFRGTMSGASIDCWFISVTAYGGWMWDGYGFWPV